MKSLIFSILVLAHVWPASGAPMFRNPRPIPLPAGQNGVRDFVAADFNGDGHDDVLVVSSFYSLAVLIANGSGPFAAPVITPIAFESGAVATGDVNGDGKRDVVLPNRSAGTVAVMLGNGDGTFTAGTTLDAAGDAEPLALADFNGDSLPDVAAGSSDNAFAVYAGNGSGQFSGGITTELDYRLDFMNVADFNGDGKADLLLGTSINDVILLGNGNGTFTTGTSNIPDGQVLIADFNHDGKADLATIDENANPEWNVAVTLGNGDGTMGATAKYVFGYEAITIASADLDDDGNTDLLLPTYNGSSVGVLRGNADGTFQPAEFFVTGNNPIQLAVSDFDRDGHEDFLTVDSNTEIRSLSFVRGSAGGRFDTYRAFHTTRGIPLNFPGLHANGGRAADMDGDGDRDVVLVQEQWNANVFEVAVMLNDGTGMLGPAVRTATATTSWSMATDIRVADLNHDGKLDVLVLPSTFSAASSLLGNGDGTFGAPVAMELDAAQSATLAHLDGDTNLDLFVSGGHFSRVYPGNGDGTFGTGIHSSAYSYDAFVGDLNADGKADYVAYWSGSVRACLNDGSAHFTACTIVATEEIEVVAMDDFNGDGKLDLLAVTYTGTQMRFGNGDGTFGAPVRFTITPVPFRDFGGPPVTDDFDGDGHLDLAAGSSVYFGTGAGAFRARARFRGNNASSSDSADMDGNGSPDLVLTKESADEVHVLLTRTAGDPVDPVSLDLTADDVAVEYGQAVTFTATVEGGAIPPTAAVLFEIDGVPQALIAVDTSGVAVFKTAFAVGAHSITATYAGDEYYTGSSDSVNVSAVKAQPVMQVSGDWNPIPALQDLSILARLILPATHGLQRPTGSITLRDGDTVLGTISDGEELEIHTLTIGTHTITADYPGDANYEAASASYNQVVTKAQPLFSNKATPSTSGLVAGEPVTIDIGFLGTTSITGTVSLYLDDVFLTTVTLNQGKAVYQTSFPAGVHALRFAYSGDDDWESATSTWSLFIYMAQWGTPLPVSASGSGNGSLQLYWGHTRLKAAASYTIWRKTSLANAWEIHQTYGANTFGTSTSMPANTTWLFAITATDTSGNVSPMSAPDPATTAGYTEGTLPAGLPVKALQFVETRAAIACMRTFAGLSAYPYSNVIQAGQPVRAVDVSEMRTALAQARAAAGLPAISFSDGVLTSGVSLMRAAHILELRAGTN